MVGVPTGGFDVANYNISTVWGWGFLAFFEFEGLGESQQ